jgi:putative ABC transport system permease protein
MAMNIMNSKLTDENVETIRNIDGVKDVIPMIFYYEEIIAMMGPPWEAIGIEPDKTEYFKGESLKMESGDDLEQGDTGEVVIGKNVAGRYNLEVGDYFNIKGIDFYIKGVMEKANINDIDTGVIVPLQDMKDLLESDTYQMIYVVPENIEHTEDMAEAIEDADESFNAITSKEIARQVSIVIDNISIFVIGIGAIAAFVGGLGVMNTMIMSVIERRKEIGVMKAIGGTKFFIIKQILTESAMLSGLGGAMGIGLGFLGTFAMNIFTRGVIQTQVTPQLAAYAFSFAVSLGLAGGLYPAWQAAKLDPVEALRYE